MEPTNAAVLDAVRDQVLSPSVVDAAIERAMDRLLNPSPPPMWQHSDTN